MMEYKYGGQFHRYSALLLLLIVIYLLTVVFISLFEQQMEAKQRYENAYFQLDKYQSIVESLPAHKIKNQALKTILDSDDRYVSAQNKSIAVADFQRDLQQIIHQAGATLISLQQVNIQDKNNAVILPIRMKVHLRLDDEALVKVLHQLESRQPVGFIYKLKIQRQLTRSNKRVNGERILLDTHIEYTAFMGKQDVS